MSFASKEPRKEVSNKNPGKPKPDSGVRGGHKAFASAERYGQNMDDINPKEMYLLEKKINYSFKNKELLKKALTHSSYSNEMKNKTGEDCNERLEFLGDSVLSLMVTDYIFKHYKELDEGALTKLRANVVCESSLHEFAVEIELGEYLYLGHGEVREGGRKRKSILSDAYEALIAAVYLDGGFVSVKKLYTPVIKKAVAKWHDNRLGDDYKSMLQRIVQQTPEERLEYVQTGESGPPHNRTFDFCVKLNSNTLGAGTGRTKREAEQSAAREALETLGIIDEDTNNDKDAKA